MQQRKLLEPVPLCIGFPTKPVRFCSASASAVELVEGKVMKPPPPHNFLSRSGDLRAYHMSLPFKYASRIVLPAYWES